MALDASQESRKNRRCEHCGRVFSKPEHLQRHTRAHTKDRPFTCRHISCEKSFSRSDVRKRHERSHATRDGNARSTTDGAASISPDGVVSTSSNNNVFHVPEHVETAEPEAGIASSTDWNESLEASGSLDDFDFGSLDNFLNDVMIDWVQGTNNSISYYEPTMLAPPTTQTSGARTPNTDLVGGRLQTQCTVDQQYSNDILRQLRPIQPQFDTIYSAEYLNLCLQMYFDQFHPIFPVVHAPTFRPRSWNVLLSISMCSIGSLFIGSPEAAAQGHQLYVRLNKAILASWETHILEPKRSTLPICQAALLGQTFGLLSQRSTDRFMTDMFQGTLLTWRRKVDALTMAEDDAPIAGLTGTALSSAWRAWAKAEELRRFGFALYIHDTEIAGLFQRDPYLRHSHVLYPKCSADEVFEASTAENWQRLYLEQKRHTHSLPPTKLVEWIQDDTEDPMKDSLSFSIRRSSFISYTSLANVGACLMELVQSEKSLSSKTEVHTQGLLKWYTSYLCNSYSTTDPHCLRVLWHQYSLLLYSDQALLERALDAQSKTSDVLAARSWAETSKAACAIFHAYLLHKYSSELMLGMVPPIHLPRSVFNAGTIFCAFRRFSIHAKGISHAFMDDQKASILDMPGVAIIAHRAGQTAEQMATSICEALRQKHSTLPYSCVTLLRKLSHWGVSEVFADKLEAYLTQQSDHDVTTDMST